MHDVVIVGAGPVGLLLAGELGLAGCSVLVLERERDSDNPWRKAPLGMRGLSAASVEAFHRRGMLDALLATTGPGPSTDGAGAPATPSPVHFAGMTLDPAAVDPGASAFRLPGPAPKPVIADLGKVESLLAERASALGVEIRRGVAVTDLTADDGSVVAHAGDRRYPARWLVGCDGGHSVVRGLADVGFVGTEPQFTGYLMLASGPDLDRLRPGFNLTPGGMYMRMLGAGHLGLMDFDGGAFDRAHPPTREHLQEVLRRVSGLDVTLDDVRIATSFTDRALQATTYRHGRVLLAGDAAHIHSPLGGQGLNTGLGDAMNLGWKLAATVRGTAPEELLDTYTGERHPVGAAVLDWTRAQVAVMRPGSHAAALQSVVRDLLETTDGTTYVSDRISGASIRYDLGGEHPLVGRVVPEFRFRDGTAVSDLTRDGHGVLLEFGTGDRLREPARGWRDRIRYVAGPVRDDLGLAAVLVRPDGVVAWAADRPDRDAFETAARRWFGAPEPDAWPYDMLATPGLPFGTDYARLQRQRMAEVGEEMRDVFASASGFGLRRRGPHEVRAQLADQPGTHVLAPGVTAHDIEIPGPAGPIPTRVYRPADAAGPVGVHLAVHGGGWMFLDGLTGIDTEESATVLDWGCAVVHPDFRVAPEHPFPAAVDDCSAVYRYLVEHAVEMGFDTTRIGIGGGCTGGTIATVVSLLARDEGLPTPAIQFLWSPALDARNNHRSHIEFARGYGLSLDDADFAVQTYLRDHEDAWDWRASPVLAPSLAGSAPALIWVGEWEVLRDETRLYVDRLRDAGVPVHYLEGPRQGHGMIYGRNVATGEPTAYAREVRAQVDAIMRRYVGPVDGHG